MNFIPLVPLPEFLLRMYPKLAGGHWGLAVGLAGLFGFISIVMLAMWIPQSRDFYYLATPEGQEVAQRRIRGGYYYAICAVASLVFGLYAVIPAFFALYYILEWATRPQNAQPQPPV
ncbi:MAG: hypothetical protein M3M85_03035 [bacterium]|nr:hypothetical protein [bacterium]